MTQYRAEADATPTFRDDDVVLSLCLTVGRELMRNITLTTLSCSLFTAATVGGGLTPPYDYAGDCDGDGICNVAEIHGEGATEEDENRNFVPDSCEACLWDLNESNAVDVADLLIVLEHWGDGIGCLGWDDYYGPVGLDDVLNLLSDWGPCS